MNSAVSFHLLTFGRRGPSKSNVLCPHLTKQITAYAASSAAASATLVNELPFGSVLQASSTVCHCGSPDSCDSYVPCTSRPALTRCFPSVTFFAYANVKVDFHRCWPVLAAFYRMTLRFSACVRRRPHLHAILRMCGGTSRGGRTSVGHWSRPTRCASRWTRVLYFPVLDLPLPTHPINYKHRTTHSLYLRLMT